ncbi:MAG: hypothetical protein Sv326_0600 [Candidatus Fermentimicrarchaeum limneticum]|uniref:Uncharacterized protein n=1 Tax=Fermentimicrarchaeum limneticum TaxID=2795018 RepID=A0A7D6BGT2_FERL1|nr:MAG: hypothetical protein Sv326_0600 [Candidatus Fermentimicrarchaeum limneticum]
MKYCPDCGHELPQPNPKHCPECGVAISAAKETPAPAVSKTPKKTGLLGILAYLFLLLILLLVVGLIAYFFMTLPPQPKTLFVGVYMEGPVSGAAVRVYALNNNGTKGELLAGPAYSDENGELELNLSRSSTPLLVESSGGSYYEVVGAGKGGENNSVGLLETDTLQAVAPAGTDALVITPFTSMAAALAMKSMTKGIPAEDAVQFANTVIGQQYNVWSIVGTLPATAYSHDSVSVSTYRQRTYGLLLAGLVQTAHDKKVRSIDFAQGLARDWSDGTLDGAEDGKNINLRDASGNSSALSPSAGLGDLQGGITRYMSSPYHVTYLEQFPIALKQVCADPNFYISTTTLPMWTDGEFGWFSMTAAGGTLPYSWEIKKGSTLPTGFILRADGNLSGTGTLSPGTVESISPPFTVRVSDSSNPQKKCEIELRINIREKPPQLETEAVVCYTDEKCEQSVVSRVTGGLPPYYYAGYYSENGEYPLGLMLWKDGVLRGTPSTAGTYALEVCVIDMIGWEDCKDVTILVEEKTEPVTCTNTCPAGQQQRPAPDCSCYTPTPSCEPGHYSVYCGGRWRCCLNGWVCCGGDCKPSAFC